MEEGRRAQRDAQPDLPLPRAHGVRHDAVKPDGRQQQREPAEEYGDERDEPLLRHRRLDQLIEGPERERGWSPDSRLLYLLLERDGFRDLYAQRIDPERGMPVANPSVVQHLHDLRLRWGFTSHGTAIVTGAFVFSQVESTGGIWMLDTTSGQPRP